MRLMSERPICNTTGKVCYRNDREANAAAAHQLRKPDAPPALRVYRCAFCNSYHLTKKVK